MNQEKSVFMEGTFMIVRFENFTLVLSEIMSSWNKITLTEAGRETTQILRKRIKIAVQKGGDGLREEERESFYNALEIIGRNLKK